VPILNPSFQRQKGELNPRNLVTISCLIFRSNVLPREFVN